MNHSQSYSQCTRLYILCVYVLMTLCVQSKLLMGAAYIFSSLMHQRAATAVYLLQNYLYSIK